MQTKPGNLLVSRFDVFLAPGYAVQLLRAVYGKAGRLRLGFTAPLLNWFLNVASGSALAAWAIGEADLDPEASGFCVRPNKFLTPDKISPLFEVYRTVNAIIKPEAETNCPANTAFVTEHSRKTHALWLRVTYHLAQTFWRRALGLLLFHIQSPRILQVRQ